MALMISEIPRSENIHLLADYLYFIAKAQSKKKAIDFNEPHFTTVKTSPIPSTCIEGYLAAYSEPLEKWPSSRYIHGLTILMNILYPDRYFSERVALFVDFKWPEKLWGNKLSHLALGHQDAYGVRLRESLTIMGVSDWFRAMAYRVELYEKGELDL
jgi:hypothetical protein